MAGIKYPVICSLKSSEDLLLAEQEQKMVIKFTVLDMRKGHSGAKKSVRTPGMIAAVRRSLERAATRVLGKQGPYA